MPPILHFSEIDSTNDEVFRQARAGLADGLWVLADSQSAGRGRRARPWTSQTGNLFCSRLTRPATGEPPAQQLSFVAALALLSALARFVPEDRLSLKWPNDLLLDGLKCSGILLEAITCAGASVLAIGIGVNLASHPVNVERPATSLAAAGVTPPAPRIVLDELAAQFSIWRQHWATQGFAPVRAAWLSHARGLGARIDVRLTESTMSGRFEDIGMDGALHLRLDSGALHPVHAGDIFGI